MTTCSNRLLSRTTLTAGLLALAISCPLTAGESAESQQGWKGELRDAWVDGKIETTFTLNPYLSPFAIDTHVNQGVVVLSGTVESQVDKDLAYELATSVEGVTEVVNELQVDSESNQQDSQETGPKFSDRVADATTTARVKFALLANKSTEGLKINVDTSNGIVTLEGKVQSRQHRDLAEQIAMNSEGVAEVNNRLNIAERS